MSNFTNRLQQLNAEAENQIKENIDHQIKTIINEATAKIESVSAILERNLINLSSIAEKRNSELLVASQSVDEHLNTLGTALAKVMRQTQGIEKAEPKITQTVRTLEALPELAETSKTLNQNMTQANGVLEKIKKVGLIALAIFLVMMIFLAFMQIGMKNEKETFFRNLEPKQEEILKATQQAERNLILLNDQNESLQREIHRQEGILNVLRNNIYQLKTFQAVNGLFYPCMNNGSICVKGEVLHGHLLVTRDLAASSELRGQ